MTAHRAGRTSGGRPGDGRPNALALVAHKALAPNGVSPFSVLRQTCPEHDRGGPSAFAARTLEPESRCTGAARAFIRSTLLGWGLGTLVDDVEVVATELVTNALRHGLAGRPGPLRPPPAPEPVRMGLLRQGETVLCAVFDRGAGVPAARRPDHVAESGRGILVVEALSVTWGWTDPDPSGKAVWAMFSTTGPERA